MTIKQLGGIFGRNPEFNDIDAESLNVSGTITSNGLTVDSNTLHVDPVNNFVGIRTQFPGEALTVNGNISFAGTSRVLYNIGTADTFLQTGTGDVVVLRDNGGTETARFNSAGIGFPSGKGIDFSATSGTGTSELLDDYEEGVFTGVLKEGANTLVSATGYYTKVGEICTVWWKSIFTVSNANNGLITITGLPFPASGVDASGTAIARVLGTGVTGLHSFVADSGATLSLRQDNSLAYANNVTNDDLFATNGSAGDYLWVHCTYRTA